MPPALWGPPLRRGTGSKKPSSSRNGAHSSSVAARLRAPPRQQRRTGRAGAKGTSWRLRFLPCPSAPTALLCVSRTEAARRGRAAHVAQNGGRGERGGPPPPAPLTPCPELQCRVLMMAPASSIIFSTVPPCTLPAMLASSGRMILRRQRSAAGGSRPAMPRRAAPRRAGCRRRQHVASASCPSPW